MAADTEHQSKLQMQVFAPLLRSSCIPAGSTRENIAAEHTPYQLGMPPSGSGVFLPYYLRERYAQKVLIQPGNLGFLVMTAGFYRKRHNLSIVGNIFFIN